MFHLFYFYGIFFIYKGTHLFYIHFDLSNDISMHCKTENNHVHAALVVRVHEVANQY